MSARRKYVQDGWNITGDTYVRDADGYFWYQARSDDMIISAGYNIAGPEVEVCLLTHEAVAECGVVGAPCPERGQIVKAYVVLREGVAGDAALAKALQDHVKAGIAPYKYPARHRIRRRPAQDADRQIAALHPAPDGARRSLNPLQEPRAGTAATEATPCRMLPHPAPSCRKAGPCRAAMPTAWSRRAACW